MKSIQVAYVDAWIECVYRPSEFCEKKMNSVPSWMDDAGEDSSIPRNSLFKTTTANGILVHGLRWRRLPKLVGTMVNDRHQRRIIGPFDQNMKR